MKTSKLIALAAFAAISMSASAQFANTSNRSTGTRSGSGAGISIENDCNSYSRVSLGYMGVNFTEKEDGSSYSDDDMALKGFTFGYTRGLSVSSTLPVFVEVGAQMNYATKNESESGVTDRTNLLALSVPVSLTYKLGFSNGMYIAPYAGIHFDLGLLCNEKMKAKSGGQSYSESINFYSSDDMGDETFKRFQMGYQVGGNLGYKQINFGIGYKGSFLPIYKEGDYKILTGGVVVTLGYNF